MSETPNSSLSTTISDERIRAELSSVLASDEFVRSKRLTTFLSYIVEKTLKNETGCLKGYALGIDVFDRNEEFNPDTDTIVRVHAVRLRAALAKYYLMEGVNDELEICLPKGRYVPVFRRKSIKINSAYKISSKSRSSVVFPIGPKIGVLPVEDISPNAEFADQARGLTLQVINDLTRFRNLRVVSMSSAMNLKQNKKPQDELLEELGVDYVMTLSMMNNGRLVIVSAQLLATSDMRILWSDMIERELDPRYVARVLQTIAAQIAAVTGSNYGAIAQAEMARVSNEPESVSDEYKCFMNFFSYLAQKTGARHLEQKEGLEEIVKSHPETSRAWAMLSRIYGDEYRFEYNPVQAVDAAKRSLRAARRAVDIDPTDAFTLSHLAQSLSEAGEYELCGEYYEKALKFNPNDAELLAVTAMHNANQGDWEMAEMLASRSTELSPKHPNWFRAVPYMIHLRKSEYQLALGQVEALYEEASPLVDIGRLVVYAKLGRIDEAKSLLENLDKNFPKYCSNIVDQFKRRYLPIEIALLVRDTIEKLRVTAPATSNLEH